MSPASIASISRSIVLVRKLRVDRQPDLRAPLADPSRPGSRIANSTRSPPSPLVQTFAAYCAGVSICSSRAAELHFAPGSADFHVGQDLFQIADARGERAHLAESLMHELEPLADERERFVEPPLERAAQMVVDRRADGVDLLAHLETLARQIVAQTALETLRQPLGCLEPDDERMQIDGRRPARDDEERHEHGDLEHDESDEQREHWARKVSGAAGDGRVGGGAELAESDKRVLAKHSERFILRFNQPVKPYG